MQTKRLTLLLLSSLVISLLVSCGEQGDSPAQGPRLSLGLWAAHLETPGGPLGFGLRLERDPSGILRAFIVNGPEEIEIPQVKQTKSELFLGIAHYDSRVRARISEDGRRISGTWSKTRGPANSSKIRFEAHAGERRRFAEDSATTATTQSFAGRWRVRFASENEDSVAILRENSDSNWGGTFLTTTGDYRYLAGCLDQNRLRLSCFDGAHAFLFDAKIDQNGLITGDFWNWNTWHDTWTASRDDEATLPDAFKQTTWNDSSKLADLTFPDLDGEVQNVAKILAGGNVKVIQIFGSWCPNCHDATNYLVDLFKRYEHRGLRICSVAFELTGDFKRDARQVKNYARMHQANWPFLIGGTANKTEATKAFGAVDGIRSYPTFIFLDRQDQVIAVYSGFSGPATGEAHSILKKKIEKILDQALVKERALPR